MEKLGRDVLLEIARRIYYPTELINLVLVCRSFRFMGTSERLFRAFWLREFKFFAPGFVSGFIENLPDNWTLKQLFIWLFKTKRELISRMYNHLGLTYEHDFRGEDSSRLYYLLFLKTKRSDNIPTRFLLTMLSEYLIDGNVSGDLELNPNNEDNLDRMVELIDIVYSHKAEWNIEEDYNYPSKETEGEWNKELQHKNKKELQQIDKDRRPMSKRVILREGVCVWDCETEKYILIYPLDGIKYMFEHYREIIIKERNLKIRAAEDLLNELYNLEYQCDEITQVNYKLYYELIIKKTREVELGMISYYYIPALKVLSMSVIRSPHWQNNDDLNMRDARWHRTYQIPIYDWKGREIDTRELMEYPNRKYEGLRTDYNRLMRFPEELMIESLEKGKMVRLVLKRSEKIPAAFPHVSHGK